MSRRRTELRDVEARTAPARPALEQIEAVIGTWPGDEARIGMLVLGSWMAGDKETLRKAWLRLTPLQIGWLAQVMREIDPGIPTS